MDTKQCRLTNIIDMIGFSSTFQYNADGLITNLTTPYGTTTFEATTNKFNNYDFGGVNIVNRSLRVSEPGNRNHLYLYRQLASKLNTNSNDDLLPDSYPLDQVPDTAPFSNTFETNNLATRNSFFWGPQQYLGLSASFRSAPTNFNLLTTNDYNLSRVKHWLFETNQITVGQTLAHLRLPSPDGVTEGQKIWYDYAGKQYNSSEGTNSRPSVVARVLPDGTPQFTHIERNDWRKPAAVVTTYSTVGTNVYLRTNTVSYANNGIDPGEVRGQNNEWTVSYLTYMDHLPLVISNSMGEVTTLTYNSTNRQITSIKWPGGLTTTNIYFTNGSYANWLQQTKDLETANSLSFTHANGLVNTFSDARGLSVTLNWDALERLTNAVFPNGAIKLDVNGRQPRAFSSTKVGGRPLMETFRPDDAQRFVNAVNARKRG